MRLIDADELIEFIWREDVSSREKIVRIVETRPTVHIVGDTKKEVRSIISKLVEVLDVGSE